jgi:sugar/nucleoside kinase (ribokinase family)
VAVGNPTIDIDDDGHRTVGGTVVYSALQAARLGLPALVVGRAAPADVPTIEAACGAEVSLALRPARTTTVFHNSRLTEPRRQFLRDRGGAIETRADLADLAAVAAAFGGRPVPAGRAAGTGDGSRAEEARARDRWAGDAPPGRDDDGARRPGILHIAPVARETPVIEIVDRLEADFVGLTPQGLIRRWDATGAIHLTALEESADLGRAIDVLVMARSELPYLASLVDAVIQAGRLVVVTAGAAGCEVWRRGGVDRFPAYPCPRPVDDTGAGDVFAAALLVELFRGRALAAAVRFAAVAASLSLRGNGPTRLARLREIAALLDE